MVDSNASAQDEREVRAFQRILSLQYQRYPLLEVQDLYKLIHQASMGAEHALGNVEDAWAFLEREVNALADGPDEPLRDVISPDRRIWRINLRPYIASGSSLPKLLEAFVRTASEYSPSTSRFERYWLYAEKIEGEIPFAFSTATMRTFFEKMKGQDFPAVHHSTAYVTAYQPAYRVILKEYFLDP